MTLTAMLRTGQLVNPSAEVAEGSDWTIVARRIRDLQNDEGLYCPHCHRALEQFAAVRLRAGSTRILHFFHLQLEGEQRECKNFSGESERHLNAKTRIYEHLKRVDAHRLAAIELDTSVLKTEGVRDRKPDVLVIYKNGSKVAHEIQISYINAEGLQVRTDDLKAHSCSVVIWYLHGDQYNQENRAYLASRGIQCYRLVFQGGDYTEPVWTLDQGRKPSTGDRQQKLDECDRLDAYEERYRRSLEQNPYDALSPEDEPFEDLEIPFKAGQRVTNAKGWDGRIERLDTSALSIDGTYYWVHWQEREWHTEKAVAKQPVCGHNRQEIQLWRHR